MTNPGDPKAEPFNPFYILPETHVGAYTIRRAIGKGSAQMAYLADSSDGRQVVLKVSLFPKGQEDTPDREMHERFLRQVAFFLHLRGTQGVAEVFGHDMVPDQSESGYAYMIQEWIPDSVNLLDWYRAKPHKLKAIVGGWMALANVCSEMTRRGICHRDLKPENILVAPNGLPKIVDFDSGRNVGTKALTAIGPGRWPGTKLYYSPEVCRALLSGSNNPYLNTFRSFTAGDLHALGVIFYEVLTGKYPFDAGEDDQELFKQIAHKVPERPRALNPEVPFGLDKMTMTLLQKEPKRRYRLGSEVVADLNALLKTGENWERLFQTPARERRSTSSRSPASRTASRPPTPRTAVGSAAVDLAPSAGELGMPLVHLEAAPPQPVPRPAVPRRRHALMLAAALVVPLVVSWLALRQHEGPLQRGMMLVDKTRTAVVAAMALAACVGPTAAVGPTGDDWLAKCPPESRKAVHELRLEPDLAMAAVLAGPSVVLQDFGKGLEVRDGPVEVSALIPARGGGFVARLSGVIRTYSEGASSPKSGAFVHFNKLQKYEEGDPEEAPSGPVYDICAYASPLGYRGDIIPEAIDPPPASERHPGFMFVVTQEFGIHFAH